MEWRWCAKKAWAEVHFGEIGVCWMKGMHVFEEELGTTGEDRKGDGIDGMIWDGVRGVGAMKGGGGEG